MRRLLPAVGLFFLSPFIAEFLLGDFALNMLGLLLVLAPMYGGGALLIREAVRRRHRGWLSILTLALAYAIAEESFLINRSSTHIFWGCICWLPPTSNL